VLPRGFAGPSLLAMILFEKYGQHQPLNRQSERYACEAVDLSVSTLADQVGGCTALLRPLYELIRAHVFAGDRVHGDETPVPVLAKHQCRKGRLWAYVRDDKPFAGPAPPAAVFFYSRDRTAEHPERHLAGYAGILQADAYAGFNRLYAADRRPGPITEASCWAHSRRKFFELADVAAKARGTLCVASSPVTAMWARRWTTRSSAGSRSRASFTTAASASPTMPPNARCAVSRSVASRGCSPAPIAAASVPL
jgi:hypothetical protein